MAHFLNEAVSPASPTIERLEAVLARLRDEWVIVRDRAVPGASDPAVAFILMHSEIGVALVDLAPAAWTDAAAVLRRFIATRELGRIPVVVVPLAAGDIPELGERLRDAFAAADPCEPDDPIWRIKVIDHMLSAADATMRPLAQVPAAPPRAARTRRRFGRKALLLSSGLVGLGVAALWAGLDREQPGPAPSVQAALPLPLPVVPGAAKRDVRAPAAAEGASEPPPAAAARSPAIPAAPRAAPAHSSIHRAAKRHGEPHWARSGNDPRRGRYYDSADGWFDRAGHPLPGSPALRAFGG